MKRIVVALLGLSIAACGGEDDSGGADDASPEVVFAQADVAGDWMLRDRDGVLERETRIFEGGEISACGHSGTLVLAEDGKATGDGEFGMVTGGGSTYSTANATWTLQLSEDKQTVEGELDTTGLGDYEVTLSRLAQATLECDAICECP